MPSSKQVHPVLQQLLLGFAREVEGTVLWTGEAGAPRCRRQLLEVGLLDRVAAGVHSCGSVPGGERGKMQQSGAAVQTPDQSPQEAVVGSPAHQRLEGSCHGWGSTGSLEFQTLEPILSFLPLSSLDAGTVRGGHSQRLKCFVALSGPGG